MDFKNTPEYHTLFKNVIADIPLSQEKNVYGITFFAAPGVGKSTVAKMISQKTGLYITANDKIRRIAESCGIDPNENRKMIESVANDRTVYMLKNNTSMIIDANMHFFWQSALNNFKNNNAKLYFVKLECDEDTILKRIEERALNFGNNENLSRAVADDYFRYKARAEETPIPEELITFTIKTNTNYEEMEKQVVELIKCINQLNEE